MKRLLPLLVLAILFALATGSPCAAQHGLGKGSNVLSLQLTRGDGDFVTAEGVTGYISAYAHSEWGG